LLFSQLVLEVVQGSFNYGQGQHSLEKDCELSIERSDCLLGIIQICIELRFILNSKPNVQQFADQKGVKTKYGAATILCCHMD